MSTRTALPPLDDPIARHLRHDPAAIPMHLTIDQALDWVRARQPSGRIVYFYAVDDEGRLRGVVPTRRLLLGAPTDRVEAVMIPRVVALPSTATVLDACEFFAMHRFLALPVVEADGRLAGVVDIELYADETATLQEPAKVADDVFQLIGVRLAELRRGSPADAFRARFPWLLCNVVGGLLAAGITGAFGDVLERALALALFVPIVLALSESVAIQSVSLTVQWLQGASLRTRMVLGGLRRESLTGVLLGAAAGLLVGLVVAAWQGAPMVALVVAATLGAGMTAAAAIGMLLPTALHLVKLDPGVAAGPIALVTADLTTLLVYFGLAEQLL